MENFGFKVTAAERFQLEEYQGISRLETERPTQLVSAKLYKRGRKIGQIDNFETAQPALSILLDTKSIKPGQSVSYETE